MPHLLLAALLVASATATAQTPAPGAKPAAPPPAAQAPADSSAADAAPAAPAASQQQFSAAEVDAKIAAAKEEMRQEITAQLATQSTSEEWNAEFVTQQKKLELFTLDGYLRLRPTMYYKFDLGKVPTPTLPNEGLIWPKGPRAGEQTQAGANMRVRLEPTLNVSEEVRVKLQVDALDNVLLGSTPDTAFTGSDRNLFTLFSENQRPPTSAINALQDSVVVRRAYGEVSTPVGILRFGRMGSHWGLGMLRNDGNCLDCDFGDTVDRVQFVTEPFDGIYVTPMIDFNSEGVTSVERNAAGEPYDLTQSDDSHSLVLAVAKRDTEQQTKAKLADGQGVLNYGLHFTYRTQRWDSDYGQGGVVSGSNQSGFVPRRGRLFVPDLWLRYEQKTFRLEFEAAAQLGDIDNRATTAQQATDPASNQSLGITQFGAVAQAELKAMKGALSLGLELGYASGDKAPGFGNYPRRSRIVDNGDGTTSVELQEPQFDCESVDNRCPDDSIRNFRFNRDYRVDMILWRELLGGVTDAVYAKPTLRYSLAPGFDLHGSLIYSRAVFSESTPSFLAGTPATPTSGGTDAIPGSANLGVEFNAGVSYETEDGFISGLAWGILFPLAGLEQAGLSEELKTPQALRAMLGVKF